MSEIDRWNWDIASECKINSSIADPNKSISDREEAYTAESNPHQDQKHRR